MGKFCCDYLAVEAGLILRHGHTNQTQNSHLKLYFLGVSGLTTSSYVLYDYH